MSDSPFRLLVVDDNPAIHEDFRKTLLRRPASDGQELADLEALLFDAPDVARATVELEIDSAFQGEQALEMIAAAVAAGRPYALAFVDVRMPPGIGGIETLASAWEIDPDLQAVVCSAYSDHSWADMARSLGHSDRFLVLRKPFDTIEVLQLAHALTAKWRLQQAVKRRLAALESSVIQRARALESTNAALVKEIAQREEAEQELHRLARHDALTGLPNRILLKERLTAALARAQRRGGEVGVLLLDLDHFKEVNDSFGHPAGDRLLQEIARRMTACVRPGDTVSRMGGDEFVVVVEDVATADDVAAIAQRLLAACSEPCVLPGGHAVRTPPSIGIGVYPTDATDADGLLKTADLAMYEAKQAGRATFRSFGSDLLRRAVEKLELRSALEGATARRELAVCYQPLVDLETGTVSGMEALLRWNHPVHGPIAPTKFIPIAEDSGLIRSIGAWVLEMACAQLARWREAHPQMTVAVNVSPVQLRSGDFVDVVARAIEAHAIPPAALVLEITESTAMEDEEHPDEILSRLAALGVRIFIDDFGSGYSSMMRLKNMPLHGLKIDRSFLKNIADEPRDVAIVAAIVGVAHSLGLEVVAEGIETAAQLVAIANLPPAPASRACCDVGQGYLLGRPMDAAAATALLDAPRARAQVRRAS